MNLSYSKINDYKTCPKKYELIHIKKLLPEEKENIHSAFGSAIHYAIEQTLNKDLDLDLANIFFKKKFNELFENIPLEKRQIIFKQEWYFKAEQMLSYFFDKYYDLIKNKNLETEKYFSYEIEKDIFIKGLIDLILKYDDKIELWDWKTGKKLTKKDNLQLRIYALCYYKLFNMIPNNLKYIFLKANTKNETEVNLEVLNDTEKELKEIINDIKEKTKNNNFERILNKGCFFCPIKKICENEL